MSLIQNINDLKPYYETISEIRKTLDGICKRNGFIDWPSPNPYYYRTPKNMYLETEVFRDGSEILHNLYTPFGQVKLLSGGFRDERLEISKTFLSTMKWKIVDVTNIVKCYNYIQDGDEKIGPFLVNDEHYVGSGTKSKLYLINETDCNNLEIFLSICTNDDDNIKTIFKELSDGKMTF